MRNRANQKGSRRGVVLIAVLVLMGVATTILLSAVQTSLRCRRQLRNETQLEQTRWLVDAGVRKAIANLEQDSDYEGERFEIETKVSGFAAANVSIKVQPVESSATQVRVVVTANLGNKEDKVSRTARTEELVLEVSPKQKRSEEVSVE